MRNWWPDCNDHKFFFLVGFAQDFDVGQIRKERQFAKNQEMNMNRNTIKAFRYALIELAWGKKISKTDLMVVLFHNPNSD